MIKLFSDLYERNGYAWDSKFDWTGRPMHSHFTEVPPIPGAGDRRTGHSSRDPHSRSNTQQTNQHQNQNSHGQAQNRDHHHHGGHHQSQKQTENSKDANKHNNHRGGGGHMTTDLNNQAYGTLKKIKISGSEKVFISLFYVFFHNSGIVKHQPGNQAQNGISNVNPHSQQPTQAGNYKV